VILKQLVWYASPLVIAGFAGIINETLDRRLIRVLLEPTLGTEGALAQVGIYGAVYKLAILITLFTQAFRYAAEPFFFAQQNSDQPRQVYADVMKWYTIIVSGMFLVVMLYLDIIKQLIRKEEYWVGLSIVPILLMANIFLGWIYNLSIWYKLTNKTSYGAYLAIAGAIVTISLNLILIPKMGYEGAAWTTFSAYGTIVLLSYILGQKFYPIPYSIARILGYSFLAVGLWKVSTFFNLENTEMYLFHTLFLFFFIAIVAYFERTEWKKFLSK
jgi:O-antigen/teichoic acid export membrane protein